MPDVLGWTQIREFESSCSVASRTICRAIETSKEVESIDSHKNCSIEGPAIGPQVFKDEDL